MDGDAGHGVGQTGLDGGHPGQVVLQIGALVVAAPDHIINEGGVYAGALYQGLHHRNRQVQGSEGFELAADGPDGGAAGGNDGNVIHKYVSSLNVVRWILERDYASRMPTILAGFGIKPPG